MKSELEEAIKQIELAGLRNPRLDHALAILRALVRREQYQQTGWSKEA